LFGFLNRYGKYTLKDMMANKSAKRKLRRVYIYLGILSVVVILLVTVAMFFIKEYYPTEPVSDGIFPDTPEWTFWADENVTATPIVYGSYVFVRTSKAVYKLDGDTGILLWRFASPGTSSSLDVSPQISGNLLIIPERGGLLAAVSIDTGHRVWRVWSVDENRKFSGTMRIEEFTIDGGIIYVARHSWRLTAYDLGSGEELWEVRVPDRVTLSLATDHNAVYLGAGHSIYAYDLQYGHLLWEKYMGLYVRSILAYDGFLYVAFISDARCLAAINLETRREEWHRSSASFGYPELRYLTIAGKVLYAVNENLFAINLATGAMLWKSESAGTLERPVVAGDRIYVRNNETTLYAFDTSSGDELGRLLVHPDAPLKEQPGRNPAIFEDLVIVPFGDERILAYRIDE